MHTRHDDWCSVAWRVVGWQVVGWRGVSWGGRSWGGVAWRVVACSVGNNRLPDQVFASQYDEQSFLADWFFVI